MDQQKVPNRTMQKATIWDSSERGVVVVDQRCVSDYKLIIQTTVKEREKNQRDIKNNRIQTKEDDTQRRYLHQITFVIT